MLFKLETPEHQQNAIRSVAEVLIYPSFRVGFNPTFLTLGRSNAFVQHSLNRKVPLVPLLSPYGDSEMVRSEFLDEPSGKAEREDGSKWCATTNVYGMEKEAGFVPSRTDVYKAMNLCYILKVMN